jgi:hypothetical protein
MSTSVSYLIEVVLAAAPGAKGGAVDSIVRFFKEGGPFMYVNIFWMACAIAVVVERVVTLMFRYNLNAEPFMEQITKLVLTGNVDRAVKLCGAAPNSPLARVIRAGLTRANRGEMEVAKSVEEAILEYTPPIQTRIPGSGPSRTSRPWWVSSARSAASSPPSSRWATCRRTRSRPSSRTASQRR